MAEEIDAVATYGKSLGWDVRQRTILVEGTTDVALFELAAKLEEEKSGARLLGNNLTVIAAGERERGGTRGVCRELIRLKVMLAHVFREMESLDIDLLACSIMIRPGSKQ